MQKKQIENKFFDLIFFLISIILWFFRSFLLFFTFNNKKIKENIFFDFMHFLFVSWPKYFWNKPTMYKLFSFPSSIIKNLTKKK